MKEIDIIVGEQNKAALLSLLNWVTEREIEGKYFSTQTVKKEIKRRVALINDELAKEEGKT